MERQKARSQQRKILASRWSLCAHSIGKFFLCYTVLFPFWNFRPRLAQELLVFHIKAIPYSLVWRLRAEFSWRKRCTSSASNTMLLTSSNPNIQEYLLIFLEHFTSINAQHPSTDCSTPFNRVSCITFNRGLVFCGLNVWKGLLNQIENAPRQQILWYWQVLATIYYVVWLYAESQQSTYCSSGAGCKYQEKLKSKHQHTASEGCGSLDACDMCYSKSTRCGSSWCFCSSCSSQLLESRLLF